MRTHTISRLLVVVGVVLVTFAMAAGSASASEGLSPWLRLGSVSRPGNLVSHGPLAPGQNEVQEVTMVPSEFGVLAEMKVGQGEGKHVATFSTGLYHSIFGEAAPEPTAANVQKALEENAYGKGNVLVTGGPGGSAPLFVETVGKDANKPVEEIKMVAAAGQASARIVTEGREPQVDGYIVATAINVGESAVDGTSGPARIVDRLPEGLHALSVTGRTSSALGVTYGPLSCSVLSTEVVECLFEGKLPPGQQIEAVIGVGVQSGARTGEENEVSASGGGAPDVHVSHPITISPSGTPFGVEDYALTPEDVGGEPDTQAGSHPFQLTTTFYLKQALEPAPAHPGDAESAGVAKDLTFRLPPGLIGNPTAYPRCALAQFYPFHRDEFDVAENECPPGSVVGVATVTIEQGKLFGGMLTATVPLFNLEPGPGEPARFGFVPAGVPVILDTSVRTGEDYGVTVRVSNIPQSVGFLANTVTFWGVPGDPRHDNMRGYLCIQATGGEGKNPFKEPMPSSACKPLGQSHPQPLLSLPTSCSGSPLATSVQAASWEQPHNPVEGKPEPNELMPTLTGCGLLPFASEVRTAVDEPEASTPSGLKVDVHVPQEEALNGEGLAPADVKNITVSLPEGLQLNPSAADGLAACTQEEVGLDNANEAACPDASKLATAKITTPLLPNPLTGFVYLASPQNFASPPSALENPFKSLVAMYLVAKDKVSGTLVKLPGSVSLSASGQITASFANNPQLPFEDAEVEFFGGERAPLATPAHCGTYTTNALFEPWSNTAQHEEKIASSSEFEITSGPNRTACPGGALPFAPSLTSGSTNVNAGNFTPLTTTISREDGQQNIQSVTLHYPPGLSGILTGIPLCPEAQANAGTCPEASLIGETIVSVGLGGDPFSVTGGKVYLTEKYAGAPFGLSIVNPAKAGPFDLQEGRPVVVRAKIQIDPVTAALTVTTDSSGPHAIPTIIEGIPLSIKHVNVTITRPGFTFNPTDCNPMQITGAVTSDQGVTAPVGIRFQVTNCKDLAFKPSFKVSTSGKTSRKNGASLKVKLSYPKAPFGSQANVKSVRVELPRQLPSRLETLKKACIHTTFEADPAACPAASKVGFAKAITPLIPVPLEGPAYFVSYGGAGFPELIVVLQGYGVTLDLHGETFIDEHTNVTSSTFKTVPDAPVGSFELTLPEGPYSALAAPSGVCGKTLRMPTQFTAQNGATLKQSTPIQTVGCKPALRILGHSVHGAHASIRVGVPSAGTLVATGAGIERSVKRAAQAQVVTIGVTLSPRDLRVLARNPRQRVNATVKLTFKRKHGGPLTAHVRLLMG